VPRTPAERTLLKNHFESLGSVKAFSASEFTSRINTDIIYYEYVADVQYDSGPVLVRVFEKELDQFLVELAENRFVVFNEKVISGCHYIAAVLDYVASIVPIVIPRVMPGMNVIYEPCRMGMRHDNCGGRQCGDEKYYVLVRAYNHVPVRVDPESNTMYSLKDIDELSRAWKERFTIGRMYAEDIMMELALPRKFLCYMIAGTMASFKVKVKERAVENILVVVTFGDKVVSLREKGSGKITIFREIDEFLNYVLKGEWVNAYFRNMLPWSVDARATRRCLASYMSFDDGDSLLRKLSRDRLVLEYADKIVLSYDFLVKKRESGIITGND